MKRRSAVIAVALTCATTVGIATAGAAAAGARIPATATTSSSLAGIACPATEVCVAVGYATVKGSSVPLAETWNGSKWTAALPPTPTGFLHGQLYMVSCASTTSCMAVGQYDDSSGEQVMLAEAWNGTAWSVEATPAPADYYGQQLNGISCPAANACYAVGTYFEGSGQQVTLADYWNGTTWALQATPAGTPKFLLSVSCTSVKSCVAVGSYAKGSGNDETLAEYWNGSKWLSETGVNPKGAQGTYPAVVVCGSAKACVSVGYYQGSSSYVALAESRTGTKWALQTTPAAPKGDSAQLAGAACQSATACTAVGFETDAAGNNSVLIETSTGATWSVSTAATPVGATAASLAGVACPSATRCIAVGQSQNGASTMTLAETWNGTTWTAHKLPNK